MRCLRKLSSVIAAACLAGLICTVSAARAQNQPPKLEPIVEPPPQAIGVDREASFERGVRLSPGSSESVEEFTVDGRRVINVTNANGTEYSLVEDLGDGTISGQSSHDSRVRVPRWVILRF
jgi:Protein of unknown function (DUF2782)